MHSKTLIITLILLTAASLSAAEPAKQDGAKKDADGIQGTWKVVALESNGAPAPPEIVAALKFVFKDDTLVITPGEPGFMNYKYTLDPTGKPAGFDMTHADGDNKGKKMTGIYLLADNRLKICFGNAGKRPKKLTAKAGSGQIMYILMKEKP